MGIGPADGGSGADDPTRAGGIFQRREIYHHSPPGSAPPVKEMSIFPFGKPHFTVAAEPVGPGLARAAPAYPAGAIGS